MKTKIKMAAKKNSLKNPFSRRRLEIAIALVSLFAGICLYHSFPSSGKSSRTPEELAYLKSLRQKYSGVSRTLSPSAAYEVAGEVCNFISSVKTKRKPIDSPGVRALLFGTACVESDFSPRFQDSAGDAIGLFQIEYGTFKDLWERYIPLYPEIYTAILREFSSDGQTIRFEDLQKSDLLCGIFARMKYAQFPEPAPRRDDIRSQGEYYKKYYNTHLGAGSAENYVKKTQRAWEMLQNLNTP